MKPNPGARRASLLDWDSYAVYFRQPLLSSRLWQFFLFTLGFALFTSGLPLFLERRLTWNGMPFGPKEVGYTWALAGFCGIFWQGPALGRLAKRFGESMLNRAGFVGYVAGYLILAFCNSVAALAASTAVMSMGSLVRPALTSLITQAAGAEEQGVVLGPNAIAHIHRHDHRTLVSGYLIEHELLTAWGLTATVIATFGLILALQPDREISRYTNVLCCTGSIPQLLVSSLATSLRLLLPGHDEIGVFATMLVGIVGAFVGTAIAQGTGRIAKDAKAGWIWSILGSILVLVVMRILL